MPPRKIILSRKGFDGSNGGVPSPILPDGDLWSIPIHEASGATHSSTRYEHIRRGGLTLGPIVNDLTRGEITAAAYTHFDPDLDNGSLCPREPGWRPIFGQGNQGAFTTLQNQGVGIGDLFLFFGWFRQVELRNGSYRYKRTATNLHVLFGWLQVGHEMSPVEAIKFPWAAYFPHCIIPRDRRRTERFIYTPPDTLSLPGMTSTMPGAGIFRKYHDGLRLTAPGQPLRGLWRLPSWMHPEGNESALGFHGDVAQWTPDGDHVLLRTVGRGQEFVLDAGHYPQAVDWARNIIESHG